MSPATAQDALPSAVEGAPVLPGPPSQDAVAAAEEAMRAAERATRRAVADTPAAPRRAGPVADPVFVLRDLRFTPSVYLDRATLDALARGLLGLRLRASDLRPVTEAVARLYAERGVVLAQPIVTRVDPATGRVDVELFEARIGAVRIEAERARPAYYRWRLGLQRGDPADTRVIDARLRRIALSDGVSFDVVFAPGTVRGETDLAGRVNEPARLSGEIAIDNYGTDSQGRARLTDDTLRIGGVLRINSLTGRNDPLAFAASFGDRALSLSTSYRRVVAPSGLSVAATLGIDDSESDGSPRITSEARFAEVSLSYPVVVGEDRQIYLGAALHGFDEISDLAGVRILDQRGGYLSVGISGVWAGPRARLQFSQAVRLVRHDDRVAGQSGVTGVILPGDLSYARPIADRLTFSLRAGWQLALDEPVPSRLIYSVSTPFAVRGYPTGRFAGDSGWYARFQMEYAIPETRLPGGLSVTPFVFGDVGEAYDYTAGGQRGQGLLVSAGVGLSVQSRRGLFGDIVLAHPLRDAGGFDASGEWSVLFRIGRRF